MAYHHKAHFCFLSWDTVRLSGKKSEAERGSYLEPAPNHQRDAIRMLYKSGRIITLMNVTLAHIPAPMPPISSQVALAPNGAEEFQGGGDSGEVEKEPEGQPETAEDRESGSGGKAARPSPPASGTMASLAASGRETGQRRPSAGQCAWRWAARYLSGNEATAGRTRSRT